MRKGNCAYTITKGPSKLVVQCRTGPMQQQVESRPRKLLKCLHPTPPTPQPPRTQPPGPWPLSSPGLSASIWTFAPADHPLQLFQAARG
uniref:Uncharacterized protein n=1 Tax=Catagonus wagneri TaxID=51154 RepID=A0A8C3WBD0_9CETA